MGASKDVEAGSRYYYQGALLLPLFPPLLHLQHSSDLSALQQATQACKSADTSIHFLTDNNTFALLLYDPTTTPPRILISPFQSTAPSFFRILLSSFYRGVGTEDSVRDLLSRKRSEAVESDQSAAGGEAVDEGGRTTVAPSLEPMTEDSGEGHGAEESDEFTVRIITSSF